MVQGGPLLVQPRVSSTDNSKILVLQPSPLESKSYLAEITPMTNSGTNDG